MRIPRFYESTDIRQGEAFSLSDEVTQHVARVLRMKAGQQITLFNGDGAEHLCELTHVEKRHAEAIVIDTHHVSRSSPLAIHIGQSVSRGERMDYAVQKATETGMTSMTPLITERCEVKLNNERQDKRIRHWQQVAVSACEQSLRNELPTINAIQTLDDWLANVEADLKLVLHHHTEQPLGNYPRPDSVALLIGPEGGLTEDEVSAALAAGFKPVAIGPRVMRTETAPVAAQAILQYLWGDLG
ncbi:16S rRNA (uracil(1498)-N(3))-methyltransferase [Neptunomonas phycophila]|uniref:16S rRNA (uracil(1498)-N(3))-methyltransferase n=1 Tax=Neptunomonas phycophila TaxID=1572645 RepID=UPI001BE7E9E6|nr:16S rRNA (uracil(1498)-N(3))-methyltransferase [Neptunomonas phycophila]MBT3144619.1 16S rRNA (uracil(1498)-N(3))-methyltransferase [Neptunomonas phycophila]MDO6784030.1 16S rRNA (uracil(1498)-N(3))-methyltransferase [Neptunomonas phycophila]